ncbi:DUF4476 domain-containing protein [Chitinophaga sp. CF418]|uniref:DUF4476 domain-containing protein n=1 Tax=Chitinophaga sp. CF418 TaxID=1855287 RepID=UPI000913C9A9|nr:DUF4476 domain-containing protein [Chitinophaga sp. CF418]SHN43428.1 protein of unknown function [Chitinophaga sp. CF418]
MPQIFKRSLFTLFFLGMTFRMLAQEQQYFVYIQSERSQPFYVRYDGKLIPSSDRGYLILSKMPAGTAALRIGFAKSDAPERQYQVRITGPADQGYLLKQDGDRGYALFNLQTFAVIRPAEERKKEAVAAVETPAAEVAPAPAQDTAPAPAVAANVPETAPAAETIPAPATTDTALVPAPPVPAPPAPVSEDEQKRAMMASLKKDLDSTFPAKSGVVVGPGTRPVKQSNKFSQALDKVVSDDRPDEIVVEEPKVPEAAAPVAETTTVVPPADAQAGQKKQRRRKREREPLTEEEKQLASAVLAEENKTAEAAPPKDQPVADVTPAAVPPATEPAPPVTKPATETVNPSTESVPAVTEPAKEEAPAVTKREKKQRKKKTEDPAFIDFVDTGGHQAPAAGSVAAAAAPATGDASTEVATPVEEAPAGSKKKKRSKLAEKIDTIDTTERPNNVVNDPTGYEVSDLSIDHPGKKDKKKKKEGESVDVAAPVATEASPASKNPSLKMINSDCGKVMDDDTFRKMLRKFVAGKDDDGMLDAFRKQTKGYCLESSQIKTLVQLMGSDESRYRLLDVAYPKAYHSDEYAGMESLLSDSYYKGRFRAMLHR